MYNSVYNISPDVYLTFQQMKDFLEPVSEFEIKQISEENYKLSYTTGIGTKYETSIYKCTIMTLIRHIVSLSYRYGIKQKPD